MYPRRVKDLPRLETDSEDDINTPLKDRSKRIAAAAAHDPTKTYCNKENQSNTSNNNNAFSNFRNYPKRSSELPALESDSDEDENLNCAILNDSFLLTPGKSEMDQNIKPSPQTEQSAASVNAKNALKSESNAANISLLSRFDKMGLGPEVASTKTETKTNGDSGSNAAAVNAKIALKSENNAGNVSLHSRFDKMGLGPEVGAAKTETKTNGDSGSSALSKPSVSKSVCNERKPLTSSVCHLNSIAEDKEVAQVRRYNSEPDPASHQQQMSKEQETPFKSSSNAATGTTSTDGQFATPQIRSFSVQRRPRDICSTQSQKTRSAIVNEFRSQKVLFQTPMAMSRQPISTNDSITLSLCDSISDKQSCTPINTGSISPEGTPAEQAAASTAKTKKSLDSAFKEFEVAAGAPTANENKLSPASVAASTSTTSTVSNVAAKTATNGKQTILKINNASYMVLHKLGAGGSSSVYLAQSTDNDKECAIKIVDLRGDAAVVEGYLNETRLLAKLQGNICVVSLYDYQLLQKESKLYMVMEKGDSDLHKILQSYRTSLPLYVLMNFWYQMLQAVNYIHQNGVIHSDLKPANFLMINGRLKLIDFGIASNIAVDSTSIIKFSQAGTFNYISPEALTDTSTGSSPMRNQPKIKISTKSDVWSLGCILYLLIYKKTPFSHILNIYAKISAISSPTPAIDYPAMPPYYPEMLLHMVKSCLQHNPKKRPSCAELLQYPFHMVIPIRNLTIPPK